jgi:hypothetical protein
MKKCKRIAGGYARVRSGGRRKAWRPAKQKRGDNAERIERVESVV